MAADEPLAVIMTLDGWQKIKDILDRTDGLTPTARQLRVAIDDALNARIDAKLAGINAIPERD